MFTVTYEGKDYALDEFLAHANKLNYPNFRHIYIDNSAQDKYWRKLLGLGLEAYRVERGNNTRETIARAQNFARRIALDEGYDYALSLESDIMVPPDLIQLLLTRGQPVVSALYFIGDRAEGVRCPCLTIPEWKPEYGFFGTRLLYPEEYRQYLHQGLKRVQAAGMGTCLIHHSVLRQIPFMYQPGLMGHSDIYFFNDCFRKRIPVFVDTNIVCDHNNTPWNDVKDR